MRLLREINRRKSDTSHDFTHTWNLKNKGKKPKPKTTDKQNKKTHRHENRKEVTRERRWLAL